MIIVWLSEHVDTNGHSDVIAVCRTAESAMASCHGELEWRQTAQTAYTANLPGGDSYFVYEMEVCD